MREGVYLVLAAHQSLGFATGLVRLGSGPAAPALGDSRVTADGLGTTDLSRVGGRYVVPVPAGSARRLVALHPTRDERGEGLLAEVAAGQTVSLDLAILPVAPRILSLTPPEGAVDQPLATTVAILFSEALDPTTLAASTLALELLDPAGASTGVFVNGAVSLADGVRIVFTPARPLLPGRSFLARFSGGVADAGGTIYDGPPQQWRFATNRSLAPGGQVHAERFHVRFPANGVAEVYGDPGALPGSVPGTTPWTVTPEVEGPVADPLRDSFQGQGDGSWSGTVGHPPAFAVTMASRIWVKVFDPDHTLAAEFRVSPFVTADGRGFVAPGGEEVTFRSVDGNVVEVPAAAFDVPTLVRITNLPLASVGVETPAGLALDAYVDLDFAGQAKETLRVSVPAPAVAADDALVLIGRPVRLRWGDRLQILSAGGVLERNGERFLSNDPSVQPEPPVGATPFAASSGTGLAGSLLITSDEPTLPRRTCQTARAEGLPHCAIQSLLMEFTLRSQAAFYRESGAEWALLAGPAGGFAAGISRVLEKIVNFIADLWVYVPSPHDESGGWLLPVRRSEHFEIVSRDRETGWVLSREARDPVGADGDFLIGESLADAKPAHPTLVDASPFRLMRFSLPRTGERILLSLEVSAQGSTPEDEQADLVGLTGNDGFPLPAGSTLRLYDLTPSEPRGTGDPPPEAKPPLPIGPAVLVCPAGDSWASLRRPVAQADPGDVAGRSLLAVLAPGGLEPTRLERFAFQFDRALEDLSGTPPGDVARLEDLGPTEGCSLLPPSGYPLDISVTIEQEVERGRLVVVPRGALAAGHRFRLTLAPEMLVADGTGLAQWPTAPHEFEFSTAPAGGDPVSGLPGGGSLAFGDTNVARDLVSLGHLLLAAGANGTIAAFDTSARSDRHGVAPYAVMAGDSLTAVRTLATDGHNRVFYSGLYGGLWQLKALRAEDVSAANASCAGVPPWAAELPCFQAVPGSVQVAYGVGTIGGATASEWLGAGALPQGMPTDLELLVEDEKGRDLEVGKFVDAYKHVLIDTLTPDGEGIYTFDVPLHSTRQREIDGDAEPSRPNAGSPERGAWRAEACPGEELYDRFQRVTIDNLSTGQSWSTDIENGWSLFGGDGSGTVQGVRARRDDRLRVRYNLRTIAHVAILGSGITVVDLNRGYRLPKGTWSHGTAQCGRRLGKFEGQTLELPACAPAGAAQAPVSLITALASQTQTGCDEDGGNCRGAGFLDVYAPLARIGVLHARSTEDNPGGVGFELADGNPSTSATDALQVRDLAACIQTVDQQPSFLRDVAMANDVELLDSGLAGGLDGVFREPAAGFVPKVRSGDLLFVALGAPGIFVFDVSLRSLVKGDHEPALIGRLAVAGHSAYRLQVDAAHGLLFAGGTRQDTNRPIIDVWKIDAVSAAPGMKTEVRPLATLDAPWSTNHLAIDENDSGLLTTWDPESGPLVVPFDRPRFVLSGLYREPAPKVGNVTTVPPIDPAQRGVVAVQAPTTRFVPLGIPLQATPQLDADNRVDDEVKATAAFRVRIALPGDLGRELLAKVESLRALPVDANLGLENVGGAVTPPGGPGWPQPSVHVHLRRIGLDGDEAGGREAPLDASYALYESLETVLLMADPRANLRYERQDIAGNDVADEAAQCRRCVWPAYLPDGERAGVGELTGRHEVVPLLAGSYVRAILSASHDAGEPPPEPGQSDPDEAARAATVRAINFFAAATGYPAPYGIAELAGAADEVPSPIQASLAEPALEAAVTGPPGLGLAVALTAGEAVMTATDLAAVGRQLAFSADRTYRSGVLGYGPLGSAGWAGGLFAHLRALPTGEVEFHDGHGNVYRFLPVKDGGSVPAGWEIDETSSATNELDDAPARFAVPQGLWLRLTRLRGGRGYRLLGRHNDSLRFDADGRLVEMADRFAVGGGGEGPGSYILRVHDGFGQLTEIRDDYGRRYRLAYFDDPRPVAEGGDGPRYGLLRELTDFADRTVVYEYDDQRRLEKVRLPEVVNPHFSELDASGQGRPTYEYRYAPTEGVSPSAKGALLHGAFAQLRLAAMTLPAYLAGGNRPERFVLGYEPTRGRLSKIHEPGVATPWSYEAVAWAGGLPSRVDVTAPWSQVTEWHLGHGRAERIVAKRLPVTPVSPEDGTSEAPTLSDATTQLAYTNDGRLRSVEGPDDGADFWCYPDSDQAPGTPCGGPPPEEGGSPVTSPPTPTFDRLQRANLVRAGRTATSAPGRGLSPGTLNVGVEYSPEYLPLSRQAGRQLIKLPVPVAPEADPEAGPNAQPPTRTFEAYETVAPGSEVAADGQVPVLRNFDFDANGRLTKAAGALVDSPFEEIHYGGSTAGAPTTSAAGEGLPDKVTLSGRGELKLHYDALTNNLEEQTSTAEGWRDLFDYDAWDRVIHQRIHVPTTGAAGGAESWRGYDAAGHLARASRIQDYVGADGLPQTREVVTRYRYDARERLVAVEQSGLAAASPGQVDYGFKETVRYEYGPDGLPARTVTNGGELVTTLVNDAAGRPQSIAVGDTAPQSLGYDIAGHVVLQTDGDQGKWLTIYDVWDRPWLERAPTGLLTERRFDAAGQLDRQRIYAAQATGAATLLGETHFKFGALGQPIWQVVVLGRHTRPDDQVEISCRKTAYSYDGDGRPTTISEGTGVALDPGEFGDGDCAVAPQRQVAAYAYKPLTGWLKEERHGGSAGTAAGLFGRHYVYDSPRPWPTTIEELEDLVPGDDAGTSLTTTVVHDFPLRDSFGRPLLERRSDGTERSWTYDQGGGVIATRTGSIVSAAELDSLGRVVRENRSPGRGEIRYGRDVDGRLLVEERESATAAWRTTLGYDSAGRLTSRAHPDGSAEAWSYEPDGALETWTTREAVTVTYEVDTANRPVQAVATRGGVDLHDGDAWTYDALSRPLALTRSDASDQSVQLLGYDLGGRPLGERVGAREPLTWSYDAYDRPIGTTFPGLGVAAAGGLTGWNRQFDLLGRPTQLSPRGPPAADASWSWVGANRLVGLSLPGGLGAQASFGYGPGLPPLTTGATAAGDMPWHLDAIHWSGLGGYSASFGIAHRAADALVSARLGAGLAAGTSQQFDLDSAGRLTAADRGSADHHGFGYGLGDTLERIASGTQVEALVPGPNGRTASRDEEALSYDASGRRAEDQHFIYRWDWRGQLVSVDVKAEWPAADGGLVTPTTSGHRLTYAYDASGRLLERTHRGELPSGETDEDSRPFIERRSYVWEGATLVSEIAYGTPVGDVALWRRTFVPGAAGLDDAVRAVVEISPDLLAQPFAGQTRVYTYLRDDLSNVVGVLDEAAVGSGNPPLGVRYLYTPYGEAHAETGPELRAGRFDDESTFDVEQTVDAEVARPGSIVLDWSIDLASPSLVAGVELEIASGDHWTRVPAADVETLAVPPSPSESPRLALVPLAGWRHGAKYRVRLDSGIHDILARPFVPDPTAPGVSGDTQVLEWVIPPRPEDDAEPLVAVAFAPSFPLRYDNLAAASATLAGRFPGGQPSLFQGAWTDPVTGIAYHRARWYDARTASWLSEDPAGTVDSSNLYAYVGWGPQGATDPSGLCLWLDDGPCSRWADAIERAIDLRFRSGRKELDQANRTAFKAMASPVTALLRLGNGPGTLWALHTMPTTDAPLNHKQVEEFTDAYVEGAIESWGDLGMVAGAVGGGARFAPAIGRQASQLVAELEQLEALYRVAPEAGELRLPIGRSSIRGRMLDGGAFPSADLEELLLGRNVRVVGTTEAGAARPPRHHIFTQENREWFAERGVDIDRYTLELGWGEHSAVHSAGWNQQVQDFIADEALFGRRYTRREVLKFGAGLRREFGLQGVKVAPYER